MSYIPSINATIAGNTSGTKALVSSGTLTLAGGNNITLSQAGNAVTIAGAGGGGGVGISGGTNSANTGTVAFSNSNNISFGMNSLNIMTASATFSQSVQTQGIPNISINGTNTSGTLANVNSGTLLLAGGNNITLSQAGNAVTIAGGSLSQSNQNISFYATGGNTTLSTTGTFNASNLSISGGGIVSAGYTNGAIQISASTSQSVQTQGIPNISINGTNTSGTLANVNSGTLLLAGGNNITLSQAGNAVTIAGGNTNQSLGLYALGNSTQNSSTTLDARSLSFNGIGALSWGYSNGSIQASAPAVSSLVATGQLSISTTGSTISIGLNNPAVGRFEWPQNGFTTVNSAPAQGQLSIQEVYVPFNVSATQANIAGSFSAGNNAAASTASVNYSFWVGIYTLNTNSALSLVSSGSNVNGIAWTAATASYSNNTGVTGMRWLGANISINMTPGKYWFGAVYSSATTYTSMGLTLYGGNIASNAAVAYFGFSNSRAVYQMQGIYSSSTSAGPTTIAPTDINYISASYIQKAGIYFQLINGNY